jgi:hypothetical protein
MNREPITLGNLLMRARLQNQKVCVTIIERVNCCSIVKAAFQLSNFHTCVHTRKSLNPLKNS